MKKDKKTQEIYQRFLKNEAVATEMDQLFDHFEKAEYTELHKLISAGFEAELADAPADLQRQTHLNELQMKINAKITASEKRRYINWNSPVYKVAATLFLVAFLSVFIYAYLSRDTTVQTEIRPGGNYATLLTGDGKKIALKELSNKEVIKLGGVAIRKTADGHILYTALPGTQNTGIWNTIETPLGGKYRITLSDGSTVILNSGSKLEFPVGFRGAERRVKLTGEAYFEVKKDPSKPFIVSTGESLTEVLGTQFNVSNYPEDGMVKTTLLEGKVRFSSNTTKLAKILEPGEQATLKGSNMNVIQVNAADLMAWKDNRFVFKNEELSVIMRQLSRWYNIEVDYEHLPQRRLYINISAENNLSEVLRMLSVTSELKFNVKGRRVSVMQ